MGCVGSLVVGALLLAFPTTTQSDLDGQPRYTRQELRCAINWYGKHYRLDPALLRAVIKAESDFRPRAVFRQRSHRAHAAHARDRCLPPRC